MTADPETPVPVVQISKSRSTFTESPKNASLYGELVRFRGVLQELSTVEATELARQFQEGINRIRWWEGGFRVFFLEPIGEDPAHFVVDGPDFLDRFRFVER